MTNYSDEVVKCETCGTYILDEEVIYCTKCGKQLCPHCVINYQYCEECTKGLKNG